MIEEKDIKLVKTCNACPEQYDAYHNGEKVGYLRLRHGNFSVTYPDIGGKIIYQANPIGDGAFIHDESAKYLSEARKAIIAQLEGTEDDVPKTVIEYVDSITRDLSKEKIRELLVELSERCYQ